MTEKQELLRSAYQIAKREGKNTNWTAFLNSVESELVKQARADKDDEQSVLKATCTPRTYYSPE